MFWVILWAHFNPRLTARAKWLWVRPETSLPYARECTLLFYYNLGFTKVFAKLVSNFCTDYDLTTFSLHRIINILSSKTWPKDRTGQKSSFFIYFNMGWYSSCQITSSIWHFIWSPTLRVPSTAPTWSTYPPWTCTLVTENSTSCKTTNIH